MESPPSNSTERNTCVVTGANGYVGSRIAAHLEAHGWEVAPWSRKSGSATGVAGFRLGHRVDFSRLRGVTALVHCAYDFEPRTWEEIVTTNVTGSDYLFQAARHAGVPRIVYISSVSAFPGCRSMYGQAKLETESLAQAVGATIIRPGLVYGAQPGGVFGRLVSKVRTSRLVPLLWGCAQVQYLVHDEDLASVVRGCLEGRLQAGTRPITTAHDHGIELREVLVQIGHALDRRIAFLPAPWQIVWAALRGMEKAGLQPGFRSDSLLGMVYQNPAPTFGLLKALGFSCRRFELTPAMLG